MWIQSVPVESSNDIGRIFIGNTEKFFNVTKNTGQILTYGNCSKRTTLHRIATESLTSLQLPTLFNGVLAIGTNLLVGCHRYGPPFFNASSSASFSLYIRL